MTNRITYKDQDITLDVMMKTEHIVSLIAERENMTFDDAYKVFVSSHTHEALMNTKSLLWAESSEFILDEYLREGNRLG